MTTKISFLLLGLLISQTQAVGRLSRLRGGENDSVAATRRLSKSSSSDGVVRTNSRIQGQICINTPSASTSKSKKSSKTSKPKTGKMSKTKSDKKDLKAEALDSVDDILPCTLGPRNEDTVDDVIDMADLINSGKLASFDRTQFNPALSNTAINFGAGGDCFATTFEIVAVEFTIKIATDVFKVVTGLLGDDVMREYKLCDNQTYQVSVLDLAGGVVGGVDAQIIIVNPNLKLSCRGCIIEAAYPADSPTLDWSPIGYPIADAVESFFGPNPVIDSSGLVVDGLTFTQLAGSQDSRAALPIESPTGNLPVQIRNVVFRNMSATGILIPFISLGRNDNAPVEISNVLVENVSARNIVSSAIGEGVSSEDGISACIVDTTVRNVQVGDSSCECFDTGSIFLTNFADIFISNSCVEDIRTEEEFLVIYEDFGGISV